MVEFSEHPACGMATFIVIEDDGSWAPITKYVEVEKFLGTLEKMAKDFEKGKQWRGKMRGVMGAMRFFKKRGMLMSLANPYWTIWWATIGLGYILYSFKLGLLGVIAFFLGHILADLTWYAAVSFTVAHGRRFMNDRIYRGIIACCAAALLVFGLYFGFTGAQRLI